MSISPSAECLKYLLGTAGIGFLYCRRELTTTLTPRQSRLVRAGAATSMMDIHHNVPAPDAQRFQAGTPPVPNCYAAAAGLDIILGLGVDAIEAHVRRLTGPLHGSSARSRRATRHSAR